MRIRQDWPDLTGHHHSHEVTEMAKAKEPPKPVQPPEQPKVEAPRERNGHDRRPE